MIDLATENRITVPTGGIECQYIFPSFADLHEEIETFLKRRGEDTDRDILKPVTEERIRFFDRNATGTAGLPVQGPAPAEGETRGVLELSETPNWKVRIPPQAKVAAAALFDLLPDARVKIEATEFFGGPTVLMLDTGFGTVKFSFPPLDDRDFQQALKSLMTDRLRQSGTRLKDRTFEVRRKFFRACTDVMGYSESETGRVPPNHVATICRWFENQEALSESDLGE